MDKYCSLLIILLIIYLTYDYCSNIVEGKDNIVEGKDNIPGGGNYNTSKDDYKPYQCPYGDQVKGGITSIKDGVTGEVTNPCDYKSVSCINTIPKESEWGNNYTNNPPPVKKPDDFKKLKPNQKLKKQCQLCVIGSKVDGTTRHVLANVANDPATTNVPPSNFAYDLCDAMVADCGKAEFYANSRQDGWSNDCATADKTSWTNNKINKLLCKTLKSSFIQFFLGFMGGIECTMKIKAYELRAYMEGKVDALENKVEKKISDVEAPIKNLIKHMP